MVLPTKRSEVETYNPRLLIIFGAPKSGKSSLCAAMDDTCIIDTEDGYRSLSVMKVQARSVKDFFEFATLVKQYQAEHDGKLPYKRIVIDNATRLETMCLSYAAHLYRTTTPMGASWGLLKDAQGRPIKGENGKPMPDPNADIRLLPNGAGWGYIRTAIQKVIDLIQPLCETLILVAHVKDKTINRNDTEMNEASIDLAGKTGLILAGMSDALALCYREGNKTFLDFNGGDTTVKGARSPHLRNKKLCVAESNEEGDIKFDLSKLFI